jgi:putative FmdB family regulatory protein
MPIYEYRCSACSNGFELRRPITEATAAATCPVCSGNGFRMVSVFASTEGGKLRVPDHHGTLASGVLPAAAPAPDPTPAARRVADEKSLEDRRQMRRFGRQHRREALEEEVSRLEKEQQQQEFLERQRQIEVLQVQIDKLRGKSASEEAAPSVKWEAGELAELFARLREEVVSEIKQTGLDVTQSVNGTGEEARERMAEELKTALDAAGTSQRVSPNLKEQAGELADFFATLREQAAADIKQSGLEVAQSLRAVGEEVRQQMDELLKPALNIAGRAAEIDADIRSKEWLSRLLALMEGRDGLKPQEVRTLALNILGGFRTWMQDHPSSLETSTRPELENLIGIFRGWRT